ncbi:hypothetical protein B0H65DRAFT_28723 [Neurospora tetraspora]|uniref:Uncharacterized protein n=1 Tax=Neurospora tetraspora TaxID=94610 RepID=A0AAE0MVX8_9PEZI|nr:hypothetical protein B0H65DRAFT_28723 [Neurospora tetraspora]
MDFHSQLPYRDPRPTLQVITAYPPQSQTSNYSYPLSGTSPGRESVGSDISSVPSMIEDHGSDISTEDEYQYHHTSRSGGLWNCFWNNTQAHEKDFQTASTPARPISHHAGSTADSTPERKKSSSRPTLASSRPDNGFAQDNNQWPLTPPYTSHSHQVPRTFNKPLPTSTYSLFPPTPPTADSEHSSSVPPPPRRSSLARPWTSDTLRLSEQTPPPPTRTPVVQMCRKSSLGRKRKLGGEPLAVTVCSPSPRSTTTTTTTTASLVFRARPSIIPVPSSTSNLSQQMASAAYHPTESSSLYPHAPHLTPTDFRRPSLTNLRRNSRGASFPRPPGSRDHHQQQPTRAHQPHHHQQKQQQQGLEERPLPPLPLSVQPQQRPQRPSRSSPPSPVVFPVPPTSPLPPLQPPPPPPSTLAPAPPPPVVSVFETDSDDEDSDSDSSSDDHNHFGAGGVVESFARRLMRSLLGGHGHGHGNHHYRHDGQSQGQNHQRSASDYTPSATTTTTPFYKAIQMRRPRSAQLDVIEESGFRYRRSCSNARESGSESSGKQSVLGRRGRLWGRSR